MNVYRKLARYEYHWRNSVLQYNIFKCYSSLRIKTRSVTLLVNRTKKYEWRVSDQWLIAVINIIQYTGYSILTLKIALE